MIIHQSIYQPVLMKLFDDDDGEINKLIKLNPP